MTLPDHLHLQIAGFILPMKTLPLLRCSAATLGLALTISTSHAADITWNPGTTGDYLTPGNWQGGAVPTAADAAIINNGSSTLNGGTASAVRLRVGTEAGNTGSFIMTNGATFDTVSSDLILGDAAGATGNATITDSTFTVNRWTHIGRNGGTGNLTLNGSTQFFFTPRAAELEPNEFWLGTTNSTGTLTMADSAEITTYGNVYVGVNSEGTGTGNLHMSGDSVFHADGASKFLIGTGDATGNATLSGNARIEHFNTSGGAMGVFGVGVEGGSTAKLVMTGNSSIAAGGEFHVGNRGATGELEIQSGTLEVGNWFAVGRDNGTGTLKMSGGTLTMTGAVAGGNFTTAALGSGATATIEHSGGSIINTATQTFLSEHGTTTWTASGTANGEFGRFIVNQANETSATATFTIEGGANYTASTLVVNGGGTVNFNGGTFTADSLNVEKTGSGVATVNFNGGTVNIPRIEIRSGTILDTTSAFTVTGGRTLAGVGSGISSVMQNVTVNSAGTLSTHDNAIGTFVMEGLTLQNGAKLEFDLNGAVGEHDSILVTGLAANGVIEMTLHNLNGGTLQTGTTYVLLSGGTWTGSATFDIEALDGLVLNESYGTDGYLFNTTTGQLSIQLAAVPEPGTIALLAGGMAFAMWHLRRRRA